MKKLMILCFLVIGMFLIAGCAVENGGESSIEDQLPPDIPTEAKEEVMKELGPVTEPIEEDGKALAGQAYQSERLTISPSTIDAYKTLTIKYLPEQNDFYRLAYILDESGKYLKTKYLKKDCGVWCSASVGEITVEYSIPESFAGGKYRIRVYERNSNGKYSIINSELFTVNGMQESHPTEFDVDPQTLNAGALLTLNINPGSPNGVYKYAFIYKETKYMGNVRFCEEPIMCRDPVQKTFDTTNLVEGNYSVKIYHKDAGSSWQIITKPFSIATSGCEPGTVKSATCEKDNYGKFSAKVEKYTDNCEVQVHNFADCGYGSEACKEGYGCCKQCTSLSCGEIDNKCGETIDCGECKAGYECNDKNYCLKSCVPKTKSDCAENQCGDIDDGCGGTINCNYQAYAGGLECPTADMVCVDNECEKVGCEGDILTNGTVFVNFDCSKVTDLSGNYLTCGLNDEGKYQCVEAVGNYECSSFTNGTNINGEFGCSNPTWCRTDNTTFADCMELGEYQQKCSDANTCYN
jgi:hypothetical protein